MQKYLLSAALVIGTHAASAGEIVFALQDQYFSETMSAIDGQSGPMKPAQYDVGPLIINTNLSRWGTGVYGTIDDRDDGFLIANIKQPIDNWSISLSADFGFEDCSDRGITSIKLFSSDGNALVLDIKDCDIEIKNESFNTDFNGRNVTYLLNVIGNKIQITHNSTTLGTFDKAGFNNLKRIEIPVDDKRYHMYITDLIISEQ